MITPLFCAGCAGKVKATAAVGKLPLAATPCGQGEAARLKRIDEMQ